MTGFLQNLCCLLGVWSILCIEAKLETVIKYPYPDLNLYSTYKLPQGQCCIWYAYYSNNFTLVC